MWNRKHEHVYFVHTDDIHILIRQAGVLELDGKKDDETFILVLSS